MGGAQRIVLARSPCLGLMLPCPRMWAFLFFLKERLTLKGYAKILKSFYIFSFLFDAKDQTQSTMQVRQACYH
jgi:hypothetical protein